MNNKFRDQLLAESKQREEELKGVNLEIEEREVSEIGPFVLIRNKNKKMGNHNVRCTRKRNGIRHFRGCRKTPS